jgi:hypothetical protein
MGGQKFDPRVYANYQKSTHNKSTSQIFTQRKMHKDLDPMNVKVRESCDSDVNPHSNPIIVGIDVTGSMGILADAIARQGLGTLFGEIYDKKPVVDPHVMFMGIGDVRYDHAPLQVSQFEAGPQIIEQLSNIWLERGGGGNAGESYQLPWYFAAFHTKHDSWERRGRRGYLFTIGDEEAPVALTPEQVKRVTGDDIERKIEPDVLLQLAQKTYKVFHLVVEESAYMNHSRLEVYATWNRLLGERVLPLRDHTKLSEVIIGAIGVSEGHDVSGYWAGQTAKVVQEAVKRLPRGV